MEIELSSEPVTRYFPLLEKVIASTKHYVFIDLTISKFLAALYSFNVLSLEQVTKYLPSAEKHNYNI